MRIKKTSQTTPIQAQVVNTKSNSTTDSYSCDYVNNHYEDFTSKVTFDEGTPANTQFVRIGRMIFISYQGPFATHYGGMTIFTLPEGYRPVNLYIAGNFTLGGGSMVCGNFIIQTDGKCNIVTIPNNTPNVRIYINIAFIIEDPAS